MLCVVRDRRAWVGGHRFELLVVAVSSPLVPLALALAPALRLLIVAKAFKTLKLAKAIKLAKLGKSVRLLRRKLALARRRVGRARRARAGARRARRSSTCSPATAPLKGDARTVAFVVAGMLATFGVNHLRPRRARRA